MDQFGVSQKYKVNFIRKDVRKEILREEGVGSLRGDWVPEYCMSEEKMCLEKY